MPLMSIIGCTEYEKEIVRLLSEDEMIEHLLVMEDSGSTELVSDLRQTGLNPELMFPETIPHGLKKSSDFSVLVSLQDKNTFRSPQHMKTETYEKIKFYGLVSDGILICYGSNDAALKDAKKEFAKCAFVLESLSSENKGYAAKMSGTDNCNINNQDEFVIRYRNCYNRLKDMIFTSCTN